MAIVGAALAFVGGLLTLIFSASASYSEINAVMKTAKNVNPKGGMSMVSLAQKVAGDAAGFVVNAFEWYNCTDTETGKRASFFTEKTALRSL